jgi:hypothetical protein
MTEIEQSGLPNPDSAELTPTELRELATQAAVAAIVTYAQEGAPEVPERLLRHAAVVGGLVGRALVEGDFLLGNTLATRRLAEVHQRISAYAPGWRRPD